MEMVVIAKTGGGVRQESKVAKFLRLASGFGDLERKIPRHFKLEPGRHHPTFISQKPCSKGTPGSVSIEDLTDNEARITFARWASILNEEIMMCTWAKGLPFEGCVLRPNDKLEDGKTIDEVKTIYEWGKELAKLEQTEMRLNDQRIVRMHNIAQMFIDGKIFWKGGPKWWRLI